MAEKDFLQQFSNENKPDSFKEEERIPVTKERKPINLKALIICLLSLIVVGVILYFLLFAPKIEMPNFVSKTRNDIISWVKQQGIETSGVVFEEVYDLENEEETVISQSIEAGKKVKKNVKLNFVISKGGDPDERIVVPDLKNMTKSKIQEWIDSNKLQKTKIMNAYNEEIEEGQVIDYSFTGCQEEDFTRACTLKINISKGKAPAGKVSVENFVKNTYETVESWAKNKKINLTKSEAYSDSISEGLIISQSIASGKTMNEGETLHVVVSKGKATYMPDMTGWSSEQLHAWENKNPSISVLEEYRYSTSSKGMIISSNIEKNKLINNDTILIIGISLGNEIDLTPYQSDIKTLEAFINEVNNDGAKISLKINKDFSDYISVNGVISCDDKVKVGKTVNVVISKGRNILLNDEAWNNLRTDPNSFNEESVRTLLSGTDLNYRFVYQNSGSEGLISNGTVLSAYRDDGIELKTNTYCPQDTTIIVVINDESR